MKKRIIMANGEEASQNNADRRDRLRKNLRENLKKRKAQARELKTTKGEHGSN